MWLWKANLYTILGTDELLSLVIARTNVLIEQYFGEQFYYKWIATASGGGE